MSYINAYILYWQVSNILSLQTHHLLCSRKFVSYILSLHPFSVAYSKINSSILSWTLNLVYDYPLFKHILARTACTSHTKVYSENRQDKRMKKTIVFSEYKYRNPQRMRSGDANYWKLIFCDHRAYDLWCFGVSGLHRYYIILWQMFLMSVKMSSMVGTY